MMYELGPGASFLLLGAKRVEVCLRETTGALGTVDSLASPFSASYLPIPGESRPGIGTPGSESRDTVDLNGDETANCLVTSLML